MKPIQCVVLAGGLGTRMRPLTDMVAKHLIPVHGHPFAHHQLSWLSRQGVREVVYCIGNLGGQIRDFVGDGSAWGLDVCYVDEGDNLLGTAGALRLARDSGTLRDRFFVLYGDSFLPIDFAAVGDAFSRGQQRALMVVFRNRGDWDQSNVIYDSGLVRVYDKTAAATGDRRFEYIDYGLSVWCRNLVSELMPRQERMDLADVFQRLSSEGKLAGYEVGQRFFEIGSLEGLRDLEHWLQHTAAETCPQHLW